MGLILFLVKCRGCSAKKDSESDHREGGRGAPLSNKKGHKEDQGTEVLRMFWTRQDCRLNPLASPCLIYIARSFPISVRQCLDDISIIQLHCSLCPSMMMLTLFAILWQWFADSCWPLQICKAVFFRQWHAGLGLVMSNIKIASVPESNRPMSRI